MQGMPQGFTPSTAIRPTPERGTALTIYVGLITLGGFFGLAVSLLAYAALKHAGANDLDGAVTTAAAMKLSIFMILTYSSQLACAYGIWTWKKWGIVGYLAMSAIGILISLKGGHGGSLSLISAMMMGFLIRTTVQKWHYFE